MQTKKFFSGMLATAFALSLAGADIASAQYGPCGQGQGGGRGACVQADQSQATRPNYQQGQGQRRGGRGLQQRRRDGSCLNNPNTQAPAATPAPVPSN
jgi:hypothetical protein